VVLQPLSAADSARLWALDQRCFPPGIAYSESEIRACLLQAARGFHAAIGATMDDGGDAPELRPPAAFILSLLHRRRGQHGLLLLKSLAEARPPATSGSAPAKSGEPLDGSPRARKNALPRE